MGTSLAYEIVILVGGTGAASANPQRALYYVIGTHSCTLPYPLRPACHQLYFIAPSDERTELQDLHTTQIKINLHCRRRHNIITTQITVGARRGPLAATLPSLLNGKTIEQVSGCSCANDHLYTGCIGQGVRVLSSKTPIRQKRFAIVRL